MIIHLPLADRTVTITYSEMFLTRQFEKNYTMRAGKGSSLCSISLSSGTRVAGYSLSARSKIAGVIEYGTGQSPPSFRTLNFFLKALIQFFALRDNILLLHASSIVKDDKAYVFLGASGAGKTTILHMAKGFGMLADDTVILKREKDGYFIYPSPFDRKKRPDILSHKVRLKNLYILHKSSVTRVEPVQKRTAASFLLSCSFLQEYFDMVSKSPHLAVLTASHLILRKSINELVDAIPVGNLFFRKNRDFLRRLT